MLLVRKINKAKWMQNDILNGNEISADAITNCIKTNSNTLSTWLISEISMIEDAVLAIVSAGDHLDAFDVACLDSAVLQERGIKLEKTLGNTPITELKNNHIDICELTYWTLGEVAKHIVQVIKENKTFRYTRAKNRNILTEAINSGRLNKDDLKELIREKL